MKGEDEEESSGGQRQADLEGWLACPRPRPIRLSFLPLPYHLKKQQLRGIRGLQAAKEEDGGEQKKRWRVD